MKQRARRIVLGAAALVALVVAVLVVVHWGTIRDHVEAWHFQLARETGVVRLDKRLIERLTALGVDLEFDLYADVEPTHG